MPVDASVGTAERRSVGLTTGAAGAGPGADRVWTWSPTPDEEARDVTHAQAMLESYPRGFDVDAAQLAATIDMLMDCTNTCTQCADACMSETNMAELGKCIRLNLDCADVCAATARVVSRQTEYDANVTRPLLEACVAACRSCADECDGHAEHMEHCRICAEQCRQCEQRCNELLTAMR